MSFAVGRAAISIGPATHPARSGGMGRPNEPRVVPHAPASPASFPQTISGPVPTRRPGPALGGRTDSQGLMDRSYGA